MMKIRTLKLASYEKTCCLFAVFSLVLFLGTSVFATGDPTTTGTSGSALSTGKGTSAGDPISASNGAYFFSKPLLSLGGPTGFRADLGYRSNHGGGFPIPRGFLLNLFSFADATLIGGKPYVTVWLGTGDQVAFKKDTSGNWILTGPTENLWVFTFVDQRPQRKYVFKEKTNYAYLFDPIDERVYLFQKYQDWGGGQWIARIARIMDRNGNQLIYTYPSATAANPSRIEDGLGRFLNLVYTQVGSSTFLSTITDQGGRIVRFNYEAQGADNLNSPTLRSITDPLIQTTTFQYTLGMDWSNLIASERLPKGNTPYTQMYGESAFYSDTDSFPRVTSQTDAYTNQTTLSYDGTNHILDVTYPDSTTEEYKHHSTHGFPEYITDRAGKTIQFTRNADEEHISRVTDRIGDGTDLTYHETGKLASITNAKGNTITYTYTAQDQTFTNPLNPTEQVAFTFYNLTRIDYPDGTNEQFSYDGKGNMLTKIDRAGSTWEYTYNNRGQALTEKNPVGGMNVYTYNSQDGTLASWQDSDTNLTTFGYDTFKRLTRITNPDGGVVQIGYNAKDQMTSATDENNNTYLYEYDVNGNLTKITDPLGNQTQYAYDQMDRPAQFTDRLGKVTTLTYDALGRLASMTDPGGMTRSFGYDARGWMTQVTMGGKTWQASYDDEGLITSWTTPLGYHWNRQTNKLGSLIGLSNPLGHSVTLARDTMDQVTSITNADNKTMNFAYDSGGLLAGISMPVVGGSVYQRNGIGLIEQITDLKGSVWTFTATPSGRLQSQRDPLGHTWQYTYDSRGQLDQVTYPDGTSLTLDRDIAGNVTDLHYPGNTEIHYTYDSLGRLTGVNDLSFTLDAEGRVINTEDSGIHFGATYDDTGRLSTATYNNGAFTVTYTYNTTTGLLSQVTDTLTGVQLNFVYDDDQRIASVTRSNGVNTTFTWDNANRLTRIQDGPSTGSGFLDLRYTLNASNQVTGMTLTGPLDPGNLLTPGTDTFTYDAASQVTSSGYTYDQRGRLTVSPGHTFSWDGASRLVGIDNIALTYNGLGNLRTRTDGGKTTYFYYNHAIGMAPIVAEREEGTDQFLRYYVWAPGGDLLYMIDAANNNKVYFYHFDRIGSTLALTDQSGQVTDAYAYTPYGQLLYHQGTNPQPFTFVGKWGVRQEGSSGALYHMRARYYDAITVRFLSRDPVWPDLMSLTELNPYQYAAGNPIQYADPEGTFIGLLSDLFQLVGLPGLRDTNSKHLKFWEPVKKKIAWLEYLSYVTGESKLGQLLGISGLFGKLWARGVQAIGPGASTLSSLCRVSSSWLKAFSWVSKIATGATLVGGLLSWIEVVDRVYFTSEAENSKLVGEEANSWNPVTRYGSQLGRGIGGVLQSEADDYFKTPVEGQVVQGFSSRGTEFLVVPERGQPATTIEQETAAEFARRNTSASGWLVYKVWSLFQ